jgi:hypothetical protein
MKREDFILELRLREQIRSILVAKDTRLMKEAKLREYVRELIKEVAVENEVPHQSTAINILEDLLKKVVPILEDNYKMMTTDYMQRKSFRAHIINAIQNLLRPEKSRDDAPGEDQEQADKAIIGMDEGLLKEDEIDLDEVKLAIGGDGEDDEEELDAAPPAEVPDVEPEPGDEEKFLDIDDPGRKKAPTDTFSIQGQDLTGRNIAIQAFEKIQKQIAESYSLLDDEEDKAIFSDWLLVNVKLYFDKFEDELLPAVEEPSSDEYEKAAKEGLADIEDTDTEEL